MKDFPLEELLSATELSRIKSALCSIFSHMRKIRSTRYPVQRALRLVEAISRDLSSQFLKVDHLLYSLSFFSLMYPLHLQNLHGFAPDWFHHVSVYCGLLALDIRDTGSGEWWKSSHLNKLKDGMHGQGSY